MAKKKTGKKKPNIILFTILMLIIFVFITELVIWGYGSSIMIKAIENYPQGTLVIREAILAALVLVVMLIFKNSYVFTQKKEKITKGFFYGLFYIITIVLFTLILGFAGGAFFKGGLGILNLAVGCLLIGIAEEFLCRGWLLNEFLERYGDTKKGVWYSIFISGIIFGLIHLGNIYGMGQDVATTITQAISAAGTGIVFGLIYYKTKNIWSVVILHGLWDFSIFLSEFIPLAGRTEITTTYSIFGVIFSVLLVLAELINIVPHIKDVNKEPKKSHVIICAIVSFILFIIFTLGVAISNKNMGKTYTYDNITIKNYSITTDNYNNYFIKHNNDEYVFELKKENNKLLLTNVNTNYEVELVSNKIKDYIIVEYPDHYIIGYIDFIDDQNVYLKYMYLNNNELSNENSYLDTIKENMSKFMIPKESKLVVINDRESGITYLGTDSKDYGKYLLLEQDKVAILNDK